MKQHLAIPTRQLLGLLAGFVGSTNILMLIEQFAMSVLTNAAAVVLLVPTATLVRPDTTVQDLAPAALPAAYLAPVSLPVYHAKVASTLTQGFVFLLALAVIRAAQPDSTLTEVIARHVILPAQAAYRAATTLVLHVQPAMFHTLGLV